MPDASDNFKRWFGKSQVVNAAGDPMVVYHSATAEFAKFKRSRKDIGMHFGTAGQAEDRFLIKQHHDPYGVALGHTVPCTVPVYLAIERPLRLPDLGDWDRDTIVGNLPKEFTLEELLECQTRTQLRDLIQSHGYDGVVYANDREAQGAHALRLAKHQAFVAVMQRFPDAKKLDSPEHKQSPEYQAYLASIDASNAFMKANAQDSWIAFEPGQIKSAIGNSGLFNRKSGDLIDSQSASRRVAAAQEARDFLAAMPTQKVSLHA